MAEEKPPNKSEDKTEEKPEAKPEEKTGKLGEQKSGDKPGFLERVRTMVAPPRRSEIGASGEDKPTSETPTAEAKPSLSERTVGKVPGLGGSTAAAKSPAPDLAGRIDGLRGWLEEIERRQGRMQWLGTAAMLIALIASGAALYLGVEANQDSASKEDLDAVKAEISGLRTELEQANAQKLQSFNQQLTSLQQQLKTVQTKQNQQAQDITELKQRPVASPQPTPPADTGGNQNKNP